MYIKIKRIFETNVPFDIFCESVNDWTHFAHLHRKSHAELRLLYKKGDREVFFYKARVLYPFPIYNRFLVVREYRPDQLCYRQVYYNLRNGRIHYLNGFNIKKDKTVMGIGEFWFSVSPIWKFFPRLLFWIFKWRMDQVLREDNQMIGERAKHQLGSSPSCAPPIPDAFDFYEELINKWPPATEFEYESYSFDDLTPKQK